MPEKDKPRVEVHSTIQVQSQAGGQIIGAYFAAPEVKAPDPKEIIAYLKKIVERAQNYEQAADEIEKQFLKLPFHVRSSDQVGGMREDLEAALKRLFAEACSLDRIQRVVLLAEPGVGRTQAFYMVLRSVAEQSMQAFQTLMGGDLTENEAPTGAECLGEMLVPIYLTLSNLRSGQPLISLVRAAYNLYAPVEINLEQADRLLVQYDCLIMLDDMDELTFDGGVEAVREFMQSYARERYAISCRISSYHGQLGLVDKLILDELTNDEVQSVLGVERYNSLNEQVRQLARNRAMLSQIIAMREDSSLPQSKGALVQQMNKEKLGFNEQDQDKLSLDPEMAEALLEKLGYAMQLDGALSFSEQRLMQEVLSFLDAWHEPANWRSVCRKLREMGMLTRRDDRRWTFCNRTTQSYFAASNVIFDHSRLDPILARASDFWWRETLEILAGLLQEPSDLIYKLVDENAVVAAHCLTLTGKKVKQSVSDMLVDALIEQMRVGTLAEREEVIMLLGQSGHPRVEGVLLKELLQESICRLVLVTVQSLWVLAHSDVPKSIDKIEANLKAEQQVRRMQALIDLWHAYGSADPAGQADIEERLISVLRAKEGERVERVRGISAIVLGFLGTDKARETLLDVWQESSTPDALASCVAESLTQIKYPEVEAAAMKMYISRRRGDSWQQRRVRAVYLLGWVGSSPETVETLFQALNHDSADIRANAAQSIGRLEPQAACQNLEKRLTVEQDTRVLPALIEALEVVGTQETLPMLEGYLSNPSTQTRQAARRAIAAIQARDQFI